MPAQSADSRQKHHSAILAQLRKSLMFLTTTKQLGVESMVNTIRKRLSCKKGSWFCTLLSAGHRRSEIFRPYFALSWRHLETISILHTVFCSFVSCPLPKSSPSQFAVDYFTVLSSPKPDASDIPPAPSSDSSQRDQLTHRFYVRTLLSPFLHKWILFACIL